MRIRGTISRNTPPRRPRPARRPPTRLARMLALAYHIDRLVERGDLTSHAAAARAIGVSKARNCLPTQLKLQEECAPSANCVLWYLPQISP